LEKVEEEVGLCLKEKIVKKREQETEQEKISDKKRSLKSKVEELKSLF